MPRLGPVRRARRLAFVVVRAALARTPVGRAVLFSAWNDGWSTARRLHGDEDA